MTSLNESDLDPDPFAQFARWFDEAKAAVKELPECMMLATSSHEGEVSVRAVLLKSFDERGFVFFTNYNSRKSAQMHDNPRAALAFWWPPLERQVRIEGAVVRTTEEESDEYFATRPRGSQLGAWTSAQSEILASREQFDEEYAATEARFEGQPVPRPPFWGGFLIDPSRIEFWYGRTDRLHDRILYVREGAYWRVERLYP